MGTIEQLYLLTADLEMARTFYEDALGLSPSKVGDTSVAYDTGNCELKLQADFEPEVLAEFNLEQPPASDRGAGGIRVLTVMDPLKERYEQMHHVLEGGPGKLLTKPRDVPWGERMFLTMDPDGYVWEIRSGGD